MAGSAPPPDEAALIRACLDGDAAARRALFERFAPRVHAVAAHFFAADRAAAADVTQEVMVKALGRLGEFRGEASLGTWLHRMTVNACLDERRSRARLSSLSDPAQAEPAAPGDPSDDSQRGQRASFVRRAVARLPEKLRMAVLLRHFEDMSYEEMAAALGCSAGTVASRLSRGHALLARELRDLEPGAP